MVASLTAVGNTVKGVVLFGWNGMDLGGKGRRIEKDKENSKQNTQGKGLQAVDVCKDSEGRAGVDNTLRFGFCSWEP